MHALAASGSPQAAALLDKADDLDELLAKDPPGVTAVLVHGHEREALWSEVTGAPLS
jgi:hypothetical protein